MAAIEKGSKYNQNSAAEYNMTAKMREKTHTILHIPNGIAVNHENYSIFIVCGIKPIPASHFLCITIEFFIEPIATLYICE